MKGLEEPPPAASTFPFLPGQLWAAGLPPRADFFQALGQLVVSGDQQQSCVLDLLFGTSSLASRQLGHWQAHRRQGGAEHPPRAKLLLGRYHSWHCHESGLPGHTPKGSGKSVVASFSFPDESVLLPNSGCHLGADTISMERLLPARLIRQIRFVFIACLSCQQRCWGWLEGCELAALLLEMVPLLPQAFRLNLEGCT